MTVSSHGTPILFCVLCVLAILMGGVTLSAAEPFEIRGWDIERFDPDYVIEMIRKAHKADMNTISLSHEVVMNAEEIILDWHRYKHLRRFCDEAHTLGMKVYFWNHQINNPPEHLVTEAPNVAPLFRAALVATHQEGHTPTAPYHAQIPLPKGLYYIVVDHTSTAGQVAPPAGGHDDRAALVSYAVQLGEAP